jgi:hypothetical protein
LAQWSGNHCFLIENYLDVKQLCSLPENTDIMGVFHGQKFGYKPYGRAKTDSVRFDGGKLQICNAD